MVLDEANNDLSDFVVVQGLSCELRDNQLVVNDDLKISFKRTVRAPDDQTIACLLPDLGNFPLTPVSLYTDKIRLEATAKGGLFFPMYRKYSYVLPSIRNLANLSQSPRRCGSILFATARKHI